MTGVAAPNPSHRLAAIAVAVIVCANAPASNAAATYPDFESQWRNPTGSDAWDPTKPPGLGQKATVMTPNGIARCVMAAPKLDS